VLRSASIAHRQALPSNRGARVREDQVERTRCKKRRDECIMVAVDSTKVAGLPHNHRFGSRRTVQRLCSLGYLHGALSVYAVDDAAYAKLFVLSKYGCIT